jgi:hypothetical protein
MAEQHKAALAAGREQGRTVRRYLQTLEAHKPRRGRKRSAESIEKRLRQIQDRLVFADALSRVHLTQEQLDLENELAHRQQPDVDVGALEAEFVKVARDYSERKHLTYAAWRAAGVDAAVLKRAGIARTRD